MNEKLTLQYLIEALTKRHQMDPKDADAFVKAFFELIRRALERDKYIKVKGLGTFKRIETDSRGSDEEESEERTGTQGRSRITFTPDVAMRDSINKPFVHFETVILNEHTHFEDMDEEGEEQLPEEEKTGEASDSLLDTENRRVSVPMNLSIPVLWLPTQANRICRVKNLFLKRKSVYPMNQLNRPARMTHRSLSLKHPFRKRTMKRIICLMCRELRKKNFLSWIKRNLRMLIFHKLNHPSKQMMHPNQKPTKSLSVRRLRRRKSFRK